MIRTLITILFSGVLLASCATPEKTSDSQNNTDTRESAEASEPDVPDWYVHSTRSVADSTEYIGMGLAAAPDSSSARQLSTEQAVAHLKYAIDAHAEQVREEMAESESAGRYAGEEFILQLRTSVKEIEISDNEVEYDFEHIETGDGVHRVYTRVRMNRETGIDKLNALMGDEEFIDRLTSR